MTINANSTEYVDFLGYIEDDPSEVFLEYFGYLIYTNQIKDETLLTYYEPRVYEIFRDMNEEVIAILKKLQELGKVASLQGQVERHTKLVDSMILYWNSR